MLQRPSLLLLTAGAAAFSMVAHAVSASPSAAEETAGKPAEQTRMGNAIEADIAARDKADGKRSRALDLREQALKASEKRLDANLKAQQKSLNSDAAQQSQSAQDVQEEKVAQLARIYQSMKAKKAAVVFERLDIEVQLAVAREMRERATAQLMAEMTPKGAAQLSMALAGQKPRPVKVAVQQDNAPKLPAPEPAAKSRK